MKPIYFFYLLIFPGLLFTSVLGLLTGWLDRKVSARFQYRVGPPIFQNFNDIIKLFGKETIIVRDGIHTLFLVAPIAAFGMIVLVSAMIGTVLFYNVGFGGDIIVIMYLLMLNSVMIILGGSSTGNIYSTIGAGREIKLLIGDELAFIFICLVPVIKAGFHADLISIINVQYQHGSFAASPSGIIGLIIGILCIQAKLTLPPFHIPEAETEIVEGPFMEYSGSLLAFWKLNNYMLFAVLPMFLILLFFGGYTTSTEGIIWRVVQYILIVVVMIIIKNTNPRLRIDTALNFFWKYAALAGLAAVVLAIYGL